MVLVMALSGSSYSLMEDTPPVVIMTVMVMGHMWLELQQDLSLELTGIAPDAQLIIVDTNGVDDIEISIPYNTPHWWLDSI